MSTTTKTYAYAVVPSQGRYGSGTTVLVYRRSNSLEAARRAAEKASREFQGAMARHGGTSGGYRVVRWDRGDDRIEGYALDRCPTV